LKKFEAENYEESSAILIGKHVCLKLLLVKKIVCTLKEGCGCCEHVLRKELRELFLLLTTRKLKVRS
jgi:hypothetical protein